MDLLESRTLLIGLNRIWMTSVFSVPNPFYETVETMMYFEKMKKKLKKWKIKNHFLNTLNLDVSMCFIGCFIALGHQLSSLKQARKSSLVIRV